MPALFRAGLKTQQGLDAGRQTPVQTAARILSPEINPAPRHLFRSPSLFSAVFAQKEAAVGTIACNWAFNAPACSSLAERQLIRVAASVSFMASGLMETTPLIASGSMPHRRNTLTPPAAASGSPAAKTQASTLATK